MPIRNVLWSTAVAATLSWACGGADPGEDTPLTAQAPEGETAPNPLTTDPFADRVVSFTPGAYAGYGQNLLPGVVLGPPQGQGPTEGSLDVLSLGRQGSIVLEFTDIVAVDGPGVDLLVFENPFVKPDGTTFAETGVVAVSEDGITWREFPCSARNRPNYPGCAGVKTVYSNPDNGISPTDPAVAGGDGFDLAAVGLSRASFIRIRDSGANGYSNNSGGFDLDAVSIVNGAPR